MNTNTLPVIGAVIVAVLFAIYNSVFVVTAREQAVVLRFGEIIKVVEEPGVNFKIPLLDTVQTIEQRKLRLDLDDIRVQVSGGRFYDVDAFVVFSITDARPSGSRICFARNNSSYSQVVTFPRRFEPSKSLCS